MANGTQNGSDSPDYQDRQRLAAQLAAIQPPPFGPPGGATPAPAPMSPTPTPPSSGAPGVPAPAPAPAPGGQPDPNQEMMRRAMNPPRSLAAPHPSPIYRASSGQGILGLVMMGVQTALASHKQKQVDEAMGRYETLNNAWMSAQIDAQNMGNPDLALHIYQNSQAVKDLFGGKNGERNAKKMQDLLHVDFMNPESMNTVEHQAFGQVLKKVGASNAMAMLKGALGAHKQQPQGQGQPQVPGQGMVGPKGIQGLTGPAPQLPFSERAAAGLASASQPAVTTPEQAAAAGKTAAELTTAQADLVRAQATARDNYDRVQDKNLNWIAINKHDPTDVIPITTPDGKAVTGKAPAKEGTAVEQNGVPIGIFHNGQVMLPGKEGWNQHFADLLAAATAGHATAQKELDDRWKERAEWVNKTSPQGVLVTQDIPSKGLVKGQLTFVSKDEVARNPGLYAPPGPADKAMQIQARWGEIQQTMDMVNQALEAMPDDGKGFDAETRGQLAMMLTGQHPETTVQAFMQSTSAREMFDLSTPEGMAKADYVQSLASLAESSQAMIAQQGLGARSARDMRAAVSGMLPGAATPSKKYGQMQMQKLQKEVNALEKGVPTVFTPPAGGGTAGGGGPADPLAPARNAIKGKSAADARAMIQGSALTADQKKILLGELNGQRKPKPN